MTDKIEKRDCSGAHYTNDNNKENLLMTDDKKRPDVGTLGGRSCILI